jgi:class 3 adenylate cyclase
MLYLYIKQELIIGANMSLPENMIDAEIAIVLTDIIGSTKFVQKHGSRIAATWFGTHDRMVLSLITRFNGQWVDNSDGHLMYFASIQDAVGFAFEYKKDLRKYKFPFRSRVGVHWDNMIITKTAKKLANAGVKRINIEGIGKNIAARTMSICGPEQILLSSKAMKKFKESKIRHRFIPKNARYALVGLYQFKGVQNPEQVYAIGTEIEHLQPPPNSEKVKRLGGSKKIKSRARDRKLKEWFWFLGPKLAFCCAIYWFYLFWPTLSNETTRRHLGVDSYFFWVDYINIIAEYIREAFDKKLGVQNVKNY